MKRRVRERSIYFLAGLLFTVLLASITLVNLKGVIDLSMAQLEYQERIQDVISAQRRALQMQVDFKIQVQEWKNV